MPPADPTPAAAGRLLLAATPIGDVEDASPRLRRLLESADVVAAEDTRRLHRLCAALGVQPTGRVLSCHDHNEADRAPQLAGEVAAGRTVLLVTDAGMPSVSDPGYRVVRACIDAGAPVSVVPGPSAALAALAVSGLPSARFAVEGFPPRRPGARARALAELAGDPRTLVFFESPHRVGATLAAMAEAFGADRPAAVCRELTKTYEEVVRDDLGALARWAAEREVRGEICLVVAGAPARAADPEELLEEVLALTVQGVRLKDAVKQVASPAGADSRALYDLASRHRTG
ncbi:16S rRNA (cytidine(1402)-2'-O)-methyltransferase [Kineococcus arenarius]|uniref:16S rRNA (cytidine(1402)-2'-O)-methyltransferase n=1 Tax=Kineococcus sp. SYSU DK007 TaxID=3383128 RepID=UPI003D7D68B0